MAIQKADILAYFKGKQTVDLATCEGPQPRLRPMTLLYFNQRFYFATGGSDAKTAQLKQNPFCEFCLHLNNNVYNGYIRAAGVAEDICDETIRREVADFSNYIYDYWEESTNPNYKLFEIRISEIRFLAPGEQLEEKISW